jgi:hypothetical protein
MAYDIRLAKLINGDMVLGKWAEDEKKIKEVALLQTVPTQQGVQMLLLPFGYPFETEIDGEIKFEHILYEYKNCPEELKTKYLEATSKLTLSTPGDLRGLGLAGKGGMSGISQLLKK